MIGARRVAVTRTFGWLQNEGAVKLRRRMIYVRDTDGLEHAAAMNKGNGTHCAGGMAIVVPGL